MSDDDDDVSDGDRETGGLVGMEADGPGLEIVSGRYALAGPRFWRIVCEGWAS